jgi:hypothetical protein
VLERAGKLDEKGKATLASTRAELSRVTKAKQDYVSAHPEQKDLVFPSRQTGTSRQDSDENKRSLFDKDGRLREPERSVYYDPVYNPFGVPPPGMPVLLKREFHFGLVYRFLFRTTVVEYFSFAHAALPEEEQQQQQQQGPSFSLAYFFNASDFLITEAEAESSESEEDEESDEDIPMPGGPPPDEDSDASSSDEPDSDGIVMPEGPPPPKPGSTAATTTAPPQRTQT